MDYDALQRLRANLELLYGGSVELSVLAQCRSLTSAYPAESIRHLQLFPPGKALAKVIEKLGDEVSFRRAICKAQFVSICVACLQKEPDCKQILQSIALTWWRGTSEDLVKRATTAMCRKCALKMPKSAKELTEEARKARQNVDEMLRVIDKIVENVRGMAENTDQNLSSLTGEKALAVRDIFKSIWDMRADAVQEVRDLFSEMKDNSWTKRQDLVHIDRESGEMERCIRRVQEVHTLIQTLAENGKRKAEYNPEESKTSDDEDWEDAVDMQCEGMENVDLSSNSDYENDGKMVEAAMGQHEVTVRHGHLLGTHQDIKVRENSVLDSNRDELKVRKAVDWRAVLYGTAADRANKEILDRLDSTDRSCSQAGRAPSTTATLGVLSGAFLENNSRHMAAVSSAKKGMGHASAVRDRVRKKLGIRKKRGKGRSLGDN